VCESLRFRSIEDTCARYIWPVGGMPTDPVMRPVLSITTKMLDRVQSGTNSRGAEPGCLDATRRIARSAVHLIVALLCLPGCAMLPENRRPMEPVR